jgi:toxin-antitoxin system PIN domain toxin
MLVVDANVLLYAVNEDAPHHDLAKKWLDGALNSDAVGFSWVAILAFLRITTSRRMFDRPLSTDEAIGVVRAWLGQPGGVMLDPTERHLELVHGLLRPLGTAANLVNDAHLAALALEHGAGVVSFDMDFDRFDGLRWTTPSDA